MKELPDPSLERTATSTWDARLADLWASLPEQDPVHFRSSVRALVAELPEGDPVGLFELGCSEDSTGHSDLAVPLYRSALAAGLSGLRRRRAAIQLASSLRNIGNAQEAARLLASESLQPEDEPAVPWARSARSR